MKGNKGITLVALVVTIIVLLILAGVTIAMVAGDNGVLNKASKAKVLDAISAGKDAVNLQAANNVAEYYDQKYVTTTSSATYTSAQAASLAAATVNSSNVTITADESAKTITVKYDDNNKSVGTVDANGGISWDDTIAE